MIKINVFSEDTAWSKKINKKEIFFNKICASFPKKYRFINQRATLTLLLSNNKKIKKLNFKFRNKNKSTDVLSFPLNRSVNLKKNKYLGDIIISYNFMNFPKKQKLDTFKKKVTKTFIHGFLHLIGFDHIKYKDFKIMHKELKL